MPTINLNMNAPGMVDVYPVRGKLVTSATYAQLTTAGFLDPSIAGVNALQNNTIIDVIYDADEDDKRGVTGTVGVFYVTIANEQVTLNPLLQPGSVVLPVTAGHVAVFADTDGSIEDTDNHITVGNLVVDNGNVTAGSDGNAGRLISVPGTIDKGSLQIVAANNTGDTATIITNAAMGQATTLTIPDPLQANGVIPVVGSALVGGHLVRTLGTSGILIDSGYVFSGKTTASWGGGGVTHQFAATDVLASSIVVANILTSANDVSICKVVPGSATLDITFSADPGAGTTVNYLAISAATS
jgi:hypothetical protein